MASFLPAALLALTIAATALAGAAIADGPDRITICHKHGQEAARTMEVARSSWPGHEGHGDHKGACTDADRAGPAPPGTPASPPPPPPPPPTRVALRQDADGRLDGDARLEATVSNRGDAPALSVALDGRLGGEGKWRVVSPGACDLKDGKLHCDLGDIPAGARRTVTLAYDGPLRICETVRTDLVASAANDVSSGDDQAQAAIRVGACSPTDPPGTASTAAL